jgi:microcystin-dependent protein
MGQIEIFSFNFAPKGWVQCNGQLLPINQNQALFSLLGTMYGGNGQTTFALPDMRSRIPISRGTNVIGSAGGQENHTLTQPEMAQHNHALNADATTPAASNTFTPGAAGSSVLGNTAGTITPTGSFTVTLYNPNSPNAALSPGVISNTGGSQAHNNIQPYLTLNFCIALQGIFPSQN